MNWIKTSALIIICFIAYMSLKVPGGGIEIEVNDKIGHALAYFTLTLNLGILFSKKYIFWVGIVALAYSCLLEYIQGFIPGRTVSVNDLYANATGAILGCLLLLILHSKILQVLKNLKIIGVK